MKTKAAVCYEGNKPLENINQGFDDMLNGKNIRGVVVHDAR